MSGERGVRRETRGGIEGNLTDLDTEDIGFFGWMKKPLHNERDIEQAGGFKEWVKP